MDLLAERNRILRDIPGTMEQKLMIGMITGAFGHLVREQKEIEEQRKTDVDLLEILLTTT